MITILLQRMLLRDRQMEETHRAKYVGEWCREPRPSLGASPSHHDNVFINPEAPWTTLSPGFYLGFHCDGMGH